MPSALAVNKVLSLDGDGDYVEVVDSTSLHIENQITMEAWVYPIVVEGDKRTIIVKVFAYYFQIEPTSQIAYYFYDTDPEGYHLSEDRVNTNDWTHVALSWRCFRRWDNLGV